jgi:hypothetical protein
MQLALLLALHGRATPPHPSMSLVVLLLLILHLLPVHPKCHLHTRYLHQYLSLPFQLPLLLLSVKRQQLVCMLQPLLYLLLLLCLLPVAPPLPRLLLLSQC